MIYILMNIPLPYYAVFIACNAVAAALAWGYTTRNYYHFADIMDSAKNNEAKFERNYKGHLLR